MTFSAELGAASVRRARSAILRALDAETERARLPERPVRRWEEPGGAFVTLRTFPAALLRGCVGYPRPVLSLGQAIEQAAVAAALEDPRFPPVTAAEARELVVEVSLLSVPEPVVGDDAVRRRASVVVGRHGLIVSAPGASGLLLPQVAVEEGWDVEEFLARAGEKAGLSRNAWRDPATRLERFEAEVFAEVAPGGDVVRVAVGPPEERAERRGPGSSVR